MPHSSAVLLAPCTGASLLQGKEQFVRIAYAYEILSDEDKRAR